MNSIARAVIIAVIISLIVGFFGGYEWKSLNAAAPVTSSSTAANTTTTTITSDAVAAPLATGLATMMATNNYPNGYLASAPTGGGFLSKLARAFAKPVNAQATCGGATGSAIDQAIQNALSPLFGDVNSGCVQVKVKGKIDISLYGKGGIGGSGGTLGGQGTLVAMVKGDVTVTAKTLNCNGTITTRTFELHINTAVVLTYNSTTHTWTGVLSDPGDIDLSGMSVLCKITLTLDETIGTIDAKKCPTCQSTTH